MKPRNDGPNRLVIGQRHNGGELSGGIRDGKFWANCFLGTGVTVYLSLEDADDMLTALLIQVRRARAARGNL